MTALYKGAFNTTVISFIVLEITKLTIAGWLIVGEKKALKVPLFIIMIGLMVIALWGHYGFWMEAYAQDSAVKTIVENKSTLLDKQIVRYEKELTDIQTRIDLMPDNYIIRRENAYKESAPRMSELNTIIDSLYASKNNTTVEEITADLKIGPFKHIGIMLGLSQDGTARIITLLIAFIIDPAAIFLLMAAVQGGQTPTTRRKRKKRTPEDAPEDTPEDTEDIIRELNESTKDYNKMWPEDHEELMEVVEDTKPVTYIAKTTSYPLAVRVFITGKPQDAVYKLAPLMKMKNVIVDISDDNRHIEDLCSLIPSVRSVSHTNTSNASIVLGDNPPYAEWLVDYYTKLAEVESLTRAEWFGILSPAIKNLSKQSNGIYFNLQDSTIEQTLKSKLSAQAPTLKCYFENLSDQRTTGLLDMVRRAVFYERRIVALGSVSATFELFGLDHMSYQGGISDKIADAYRLPGSTLIPSNEDSLLHAALND